MGTWMIGLGFGVVLWTLLEYVLHRWVFHARVLGRRLAREHIQHHASVDWFAPLSSKLMIAAPVVGALSVASALVLGVELGTSVPIGVVSGWLVYEVIHRRIHVSAPFGAYGRWARRHHLLHHFGHGDSNHGVTSPLWDIVFRTLAPVETVKVPRRHATKFPWLIESAASIAPASLEIAPQYAGEYRLVG